MTQQQEIEHDEVRFELDGSVARVVLTRPRAINALSVAMVDRVLDQLHRWADEPGVERLELRGEGERGFCSGADVRAIRQLVLDHPEQAVRFFATEYELDALIAHFPRPVTAFLHGISMGGGLGLALHAGHVVADVDLQLAMPETGIGLFPDVGVTWELARTPGEVGTWLAMTGESIDAASALHAGLVDEVTGAVDPERSQLARDRG